MKLIILFFLSFFISITPLIGQNLVPNPSFEEYSSCPSNDGQSYFADWWSKYSNTFSTPDYYNVCSQSNEFGIPKSLFSYQNERKNCNAYIGLVTWGASGNDREYIGIELNEQLVIGQKYFLSFYLVQSEYFLTNTYYGMPSNGMGIRLSTVPFSENNPCPIDNFSHLYTENIILDSVNWTKISSSFISDSNYRFLIIGNFFDDNNTSTIPYQCGNCLNSGSYYLVDDICISTDSLVCNPANETSCEAGINMVESNKFKIYPNPSNGKFVIENVTPDPYDILVYDTYGHIIFENKIYAYFDLDLTNFSKGLYLIKAINQDTKSHFYNKIITH